jgi:hypothetical protein
LSSGLLAGIAYLARSYGIAAMDQNQEGYQSVLSQLADAITGHGRLLLCRATVPVAAGFCTLQLAPQVKDHPELGHCESQKCADSEKRNQPIRDAADDRNL